jgi:hypothetical protein
MRIIKTKPNGLKKVIKKIAPNQIWFARNKLNGGHAMKAKIISMIITAIVSIATVVSAIFAVLSYLKM